MSKVCFFVFMLLGLSFPAFAQDSDSLTLVKASKAFELASVKSDSAYLLAKEALRNGQNNSFNRGIANAYNALGWVFMHKGTLDSSFFYLNESRNIFLRENSPYDVTRVDINLTEVLTKQSRFGEALVFALEADSLSNDLNDLPLQTDTKRLLGILYREQGDNDKSIEYFNEAIKGFEIQGDLRRYINTAISLSILLRKMNRADSSLTVLEKCLKIVDGKDHNEYQLAMIREHLGDTFYMKGLFEESLRQYILAYKLFEKLGNKADMAYEALVIGKAQMALKKYEDAEFYLTQAFNISESLGFLNYQFDAASELANLHEETEQWQKAFNYLRIAGVKKEGLDQQKQLDNLNALKEKYESEKRDQEIALLRSNMELENSRSRRRMQFQIFSIVLFLAISGFAYLLFTRYRLKRELHEQLLRNQISSDLHDEIGSTLSSIDINSRIALLKVEDKDAVARQLQKIHQNTQSIMDNLSQIVWSINPKNDGLEKLIFRMKDFASEILEPLGMQYSFHQENIPEEIRINPITRKNIYLIFKESINNCAKYSEASEVSVSLEVKNNRLCMIITDNGKGFDFQKNLEKSNGLPNMQNRSNQIKGNLNIVTEPGKGTKIKLEIPVT